MTTPYELIKSYLEKYKHVGRVIERLHNNEVGEIAHRIALYKEPRCAGLLYEFPVTYCYVYVGQTGIIIIQQTGQTPGSAITILYADPEFKARLHQTIIT